MKPRPRRMQRSSQALIGIAISALLAACVSRPRIDWASEVGLMTFDEVHEELGEPIKTEKQSDGSIKAQWLVRIGKSASSSPHTELDLYEHDSQDQRRLLSPHIRDQIHVPSSGINPSEYVELIFDDQGLLKEAHPFFR